MKTKEKTTTIALRESTKRNLNTILLHYIQKSGNYNTSFDDVVCMMIKHIGKEK